MSTHPHLVKLFLSSDQQISLESTIYSNTPQIICPSDAMVHCAQDPDPEIYGEATVVDFPPCETDVLIEYSDEEILDQCGFGIISRTWKATDCDGNEYTCTQTLTVVARHDYAICFPADLDIDEGDPIPGVTTIKEGDCDLLAISTLPDEIFAAGDLNALYKIRRTYRVINWCEFDGESLPVIVDVECDNGSSSNPVCVIVEPDGTTYYDQNANPFDLIPPSSNACGYINPEGHWKNSLPVSGMNPAGDISITSRGFWQYTQFINVFENPRPRITCPGNITLQCGESIDTSATGVATASDNSPTSITYTTSYDPASGCTYETPDGLIYGVSGTGTYTRRWIATDLGGKADTCYQEITVNDMSSPNLELGSISTIDTFCSMDDFLTNGFFTDVDAWWQGGGIAEDTCADGTNSLDTSSWESMLVQSENALSVTYSISDSCGNPSSKTVEIVIGDFEAPIISGCPAQTSLTVSGRCDGLMPDLSAMAVGVDNCTPSDNLSWSQSPAIGSPLSNGTIAVTLTLTDQAGLTAQCIIQVEVSIEQASSYLSCGDDIVAQSDCRSGRATVELPIPVFPTACPPDDLSFRFALVDKSGDVEGMYSQSQSSESNTISLLPGRYIIEWSARQADLTESCSYFVDVDAVLPVGEEIPILGPRYLCQGTTAVPYATQVRSGVAEYHWSYSGTGVEIDANGSEAISIDFQSRATSGILSLAITDSCGDRKLVEAIKINVGSKLVCDFIHCAIEHILVDSKIWGLPLLPSIFHASRALTADLHVQSGNTFVFRAGESVLLKPGFEVDIGSLLQIDLETCPFNLTEPDDAKD